MTATFSIPVINPQSGKLETIRLNSLDERGMLAKQGILYGDDALLVDGIQRTDPNVGDATPADILEKWRAWQARNRAMSNAATREDKITGCPYPTFLSTISPQR